MRSDWIPKGDMEKILSALTPENRLALEVSLATGLRIGDVLALKTETLKKRFTIKEEKTGKTRSVYLPVELLDRCISFSGRFYVFEHRTNAKKHRTRQAVYKDLKNTAKRFNIHKQVSPHSTRKVYAVDKFEQGVPLKKIQKLLNHSSEAVTMVYAMANCLEKKKKKS